MLRRRLDEQRKLSRVGRRQRGAGDHAVLALQGAKHLAGAAHDLTGQAGQLRHVRNPAALPGAWESFMTVR